MTLNPPHLAEREAASMLARVLNEAIRGDVACELKPEKLQLNNQGQTACWAKELHLNEAVIALANIVLVR